MQAYGSLAAIQRAIIEGKLNCEQLVHHYLQRIEATTAHGIYVEVFSEEIQQRAVERDQQREAGTLLGPLDGCIVSLKDNICYAQHGVSAGSRILEGFQSLYSATAVERLLAAGALIIGRTNCDEFGMGSATEFSVHGPTLNGADPERVPGGSSGGAAVSVQLDTCLVAIGSDTGGSVRQPASFCGLYGLKPTYGRISRYGLIAYASSFDQIGLIGSHPSDLTQVLQLIAGPDAYDATAIQTPHRTEELPKKLRIAYLPAAFEHPQLDPAIAETCQTTLQQWQQAGHALQPVTFELLDYIVPAYYVLATAEASSNLARYDGLRYGYRSPEARNLQETYELSRTEGFGPEVKRRILLGTFVLSAGYYDAYYGKAQRLRRLLRDQLLAVFEEADFLLLPVSPEVAWEVGRAKADPVATYLADIYTVLANLTGLPALAIPAGQHPENKLPIGYQLMAAPAKEDCLLRYAAQLMEANSSH